MINNEKSSRSPTDYAVSTHAKKLNKKAQPFASHCGRSYEMLIWYTDLKIHRDDNR